MGHLDQAARYSAKRHDAAGHQAWLLPKLLGHWRFTRWLDTRRLPFPGEPNRTCDTVAEWHRLANDHPPLATVQEYKVEPGQAAYEQLTRYVQAVREELPYQAESPVVSYDVIGVLVFLTGPPQPETWSMTPPDTGGLGQTITFRVLSVAGESAADHLARIGQGELSRCILPWVPLMQGGDEPAVQEEWKRLAATEPEPWKAADYGALALIFAEAVGRRPSWQRALEGFGMQESQIVNEWLAQGEARGEVWGRLAGRVEGRLETARCNTEALLRNRFGWSNVPDDIRQRLYAETDPEKLQRWFDLALEAASLEAFRAGLVNDHPPPG